MSVVLEKINTDEELGALPMDLEESEWFREITPAMAPLAVVGAVTATVSAFATMWFVANGPG